MNPRIYNRLLLRLLGLPIAALAVLALLLGYGLQQYDQAARRVDHSDQIIAHYNHLIKLIVDEETGVRGYLLVHDPIFLQPMREAGPLVSQELETLKGLAARRPDAVDRVKRIQAAHQAWEQEANREVQSPPAPQQMGPALLARKQGMDSIRAQIEEALHDEVQLRTSRSAGLLRFSKYSWVGLYLLAALAASLIAWQTKRIFHALTSTYNHQINEVLRRGEEAYAREQWLNITIRSIGDAVIACDAEGRVDFMNVVAEKLTGWKEEEARGHSLHEVFPIFNEETRIAVENPVDKVRRLGTIVGLANHTFLVSKKGAEICIDDSGAPIRDSQGKMIGVVLVFRDISDRRISEGALMRAEKLAAAGRLAATVAHEVNNPLEGLTNLVYIARRTDDLDEARTLLTQAEEELARIAHITRQSLGFYRETTTPAHFKPSTVVKEVAGFYSIRAATLGVSFLVRTNTDVEVLGAAGELRQVLSNLIANSLDACTTGSTILIKAGTAVDPRDPSRTGVRITVADTGLGVPPEHLHNIFEPFFTTKKDTGTGLGLWVSRELVQKHGGTLRVRSRTAHPRSGTIFSLFLPKQNDARPLRPSAREDDPAAAAEA